jgi:hypothetical protein
MIKNKISLSKGSFDKTYDLEGYSLGKNKVNKIFFLVDS